VIIQAMIPSILGATRETTPAAIRAVTPGATQAAEIDHDIQESRVVIQGIRRHQAPAACQTDPARCWRLIPVSGWEAR